MTCRFAAIQYGNYEEALKIVTSGVCEPYFGMRYAVETLRRLFSDHPHLVISLSGSCSLSVDGASRLVGMPCPELPSFLPATLAEVLWGRQVLRELRAFRPTHVLLRTADPWLAIPVLRYCIHHRVSVLAVFACCIDPARGVKDRALQRVLIRMLNHPVVCFVGNHKRFAAQTLIDRGVSADKVIAWDWPGQREPGTFAPKALINDGVVRILYVGGMVEAKGMGDMLDATALLHSRGVRVRVTAVGDGQHLDRFRTQAECLPIGTVDFTGRLGNDQVFQLMLSSHLVCVPSRHEFTEGMPLTLTEALASRTPVIASDHPIIRRAFVDGEGIRFFRAGDPSSLAEAICAAVSTPGEYADLSTRTLAAFERVRCATTFGDLIAKWREMVPIDRDRARAGG